MIQALGEGPIVSKTQYRILLNRMKDKKFQALKEYVDKIGIVDTCYANLVFFHRFSRKGYYIGRKLYIPSNGEGISRLDVKFSNGDSVSFHMIMSFSKIYSLLKDIEIYFLNPEFEKNFSVEKSETGQIYLLLDISHKGEDL